MKASSDEIFHCFTLLQLSWDQMDILESSLQAGKSPNVHIDGPL